MTSEPAPPAFRRVPVEATGYWLVEPGRRPSAPALVGLHGFGQTATDFLSITRKMAGAEPAVLAPQGFNQLWERSTRTITFSWLTAFERDDNVRRNNQFLDRVLDAAIAEGTVDPEAIFLLGFSQGSSVAYRYAAARPGRVRGIVSACADLPPDVEADLERLAGTSVLVAYGLHDPIFPQEKPLHAAEALRAGGIDVELVSFDRGHVIPSSLAPRVQEWMRRATTERWSPRKFANG